MTVVKCAQVLGPLLLVSMLTVSAQVETRSECLLRYNNDLTSCLASSAQAHTQRQNHAWTQYYSDTSAARTNYQWCLYWIENPIGLPPTFDYCNNQYEIAMSMATFTRNIEMDLAAMERTMQDGMCWDTYRAGILGCPLE